MYGDAYPVLQVDHMHLTVIAGLKVIAAIDVVGVWPILDANKSSDPYMIPAGMIIQ